MRLPRFLLVWLPISGWLNALPTRSESLELHLQRREKETGEVRVTPTRVEATRMGLVIVDMWNWHWCKTSTARVASLVPRLSRVVAEARRLGMTIFWCPSDVADNYVGTPAYERAFETRWVPLPSLPGLVCPPPADGGGCTCGRERCQVNYGWDGMHPDLRMEDTDYLPNDLETLYSLCRERGLTHLVYLGVHTQVCLLGKSIGLRNLTRAGLQCILARDLTDAHARYDPMAGVTPDSFTAEVVAHFERHLAPTLDFVEELRRAGRWDARGPVDPVRLAPWGTPQRPHFFDEPIRITLSAPWQPQAVLRYTTDGSDPKPSSQAYSTPLETGETLRLKAAGFLGETQVTLTSEGYFARLPDRPPPPEIRLSALSPLRVAGPGHSPSSRDHYFTAGTRSPQTNVNNRGQPLRIRREVYGRGYGVHAPNQMVYALAPEHGRFVALAGADDQLHDDRHGANLGRYPTLIFRVLVDGVVRAESPVMRPGEPAWRFDVPIPTGARRLALVTTDAGDGNREDLGNWVEAGFLRR